MGFNLGFKGLNQCVCFFLSLYYTTMNNTININSTIKQKKSPHCSVEFYHSLFIRRVLIPALAQRPPNLTHIFIILLGTSRQILWRHITKSYCCFLLHSATSLTLRQYPVSISSAHLAHFEYQLLVCDVWDCHDVIYAHHPFYIPRTPQAALLNQEYMSELISTNTYMI